MILRVGVQILLRAKRAENFLGLYPHIMVHMPFWGGTTATKRGIWTAYRTVLLQILTGHPVQYFSQYLRTFQIGLPDVHVDSVDSAPSPRSLLFFVADSVCMSVTLLQIDSSSLIVSRWNRSIFWPSLRGKN